jgi:hypothetical protein
MPLELVILFVQAYNDTNTDKIIFDHTEKTLRPDKYKQTLIKELTKRLNMCNDQLCWFDQKFASKIEKIYKNAKKEYFRPTGPQGKFTWLNTININEVLEQYEKKHPEFKFLGAVPADFDSLNYYNFKKKDILDLVDKGKTKFGIVFNLDNHDQSGSHWTSAYADVKNGLIYYSDSYASPPDSRFCKLLRRFAQISIEKFNIDRKILDVNYNSDMRHQYGGSECGMYSINFIIRLLEGDSFAKITSKRITDERINKYREIYFNNVKLN